jgi:hypothetical protein
MSQISASDLRRAASIKDKIDSLQSELSKLLGHLVQKGRVSSAAPAAKKTGRRKMSAAAKAKIAAAARARWAKVRAAGEKRL